MFQQDFSVYENIATLSGLLSDSNLLLLFVVSFLLLHFKVKGAQRTVEELWENLTSDNCLPSQPETEEAVDLPGEEVDASFLSTKDVDEESQTTTEDALVCKQRRTENAVTDTFRDDSGAAVMAEDASYNPGRQKDYGNDNVEKDANGTDGYYLQEELCPGLTRELAEWLEQETGAEDDDSFLCSAPETQFANMHLYDAQFDGMLSTGFDSSTDDSHALSPALRQDGGSVYLMRHRASHAESGDSQRPCIFFLSGSCLRADCRYSMLALNLAQASC